MLFSESTKEFSATVTRLVRGLMVQMPIWASGRVSLHL